MAEFCKDCAKEVGMPFNGYPVFCEECGIYIEHSPFKQWILNQIDKLIKLIKQ
uniref:hypothetical protein n=1 Tax=Ornithobacterium rhinotracheale TaxID=28251 RepID=UPI0026C2818A